MTFCLIQYRYDPLDRLVTCALANESPSQRFYQHLRLATEVQGDGSNSVFQYADQLLAQRTNASTQLLATDSQRSVLSADQHTRQGYSPYGQRSIFSGVGSLLGFNGERPDLLTGHYLLGNGYRAYNPVLMRFNSPDSVSPFGEGGINAYAYCSGDPLNREDSTGKSWIRNITKFLDYIDGHRIRNRVQAPPPPPPPPSPVASTRLNAHNIFSFRPPTFPSPLSSTPSVAGSSSQIALPSTSLVSTSQRLSASSELLVSLELAGSRSYSGSTTSLDSSSSWSSSASSEHAVSTSRLISVVDKKSGLPGVSWIRRT